MGVDGYNIKSDKGFTLLELVISVAIIGVLAAFSIQGYYSYVLRARMVELFSFAESAKTSVSEVYMSTGVMPNNNQEAVFVPMTSSQTQFVPNETYQARYKFVSVYQGGRIIFYDYLFHYDLSKQELVSQNLVIAIMKPVVHEGSINWQCGVPGDLVANVQRYFKYLPPTCRNVVNYF